MDSNLLKFCVCSNVKIMEFVTAEPLNSGYLRVLRNWSVIKRCQLLGSSLTKIFIFGSKYFVRYSRHIGYLGCLLLKGFTLFCKHASTVMSLSKHHFHCMKSIQLRNFFWPVFFRNRNEYGEIQSFSPYLLKDSKNLRTGYELFKGCYEQHLMESIM